MQCLIDADVLVYEVGFAAESGWQHEGFPPFHYVEELLNNRIANIVAVAGNADGGGELSSPILYLTGGGNFRYDIAKLRPYKDRPSNKPWHYKNIKAYLKAVYNVVESSGMEADDLMAIEQTKRPNETIICTRDKDLRQVAGWHYGWELANQPQFGPQLVDDFGMISLSADRKTIRGYGKLFFYSQCLTGDKVDSIPGLPNCGAVKSYNLLKDIDYEYLCWTTVLGQYAEVYGEDARNQMLEQARLLWMTRELHPDGSPVLWEHPVDD